MFTREEKEILYNSVEYKGSNDKRLEPHLIVMLFISSD